MSPPTGPPTGPLPNAAPVPAPPPRRGRAALIGAVVAVLALGGAGVFAVSQITGDDGGGASSPDELGTQIMASLEAEDVLGLIDVLEPGERDVLRDPAIELVEELARLEVLSPAANLSKIDGVDVVIEGESVRVRPTNVPDITNLELGGTISATVDGEALPIGDLLLDWRGDDLDLSELDAEESTELDVELTAVEVDGRWYLSVFHTIAEQVRQDLDAVPDIPTTGVEPTGGDTPEGALDALLDGVEALDVEQVIAALNPGEAAALQRYAPLFLDDAEAALADPPLTWEITERTYTIDGDGDTREATIDVLRIEGELDGLGPFELALEDGCLTISGNTDISFDSCESGDAPLTPEDLGFDPELLDDLQALAEDVADDYEQPGLVLRRHDGRWFVSPVGTVLEQVLAVSRALDREEIDLLIDELPVLLQQLVLGSLDGAFGEDDWADDEWPDDEWPDDEWIEEEWPPTTDVYDTTPTTIVGDESADECFELTDATEATACYEARLAAGEIEPWEFPLELRYPECGVAEAYWAGYSLLDDAAFIALMEQAGPCFRALAERGEVDWFDLAPEYTDLECFEGRNWYAVFDDPAYDERFEECVWG